MVANTVDEFVQERVAPELQPIVARLRELICYMAPTTTEKISYDMPVFTGRKIVAYITAARHHITLSFTYGARLEDKYGLLRGKAKGARYLQYKNLADINKTVLRYHLKQAVALDRA